MATTTPVSVTHITAAQDEVVRTSMARKALALLRIGYGLTFLWAFFDKLLALGYATGWNQAQTSLDRFGSAAWYHGGSPTHGFLSSVNPNNWFHGAYTSMAGATWADWLFMLGLLGIGISLTFGVAMRIGGAAACAMYVLMWAASFPLVNNPVIDDHVLGAISAVVLALTLAGDTWGFGRWWSRIELVRTYPALR